jgi:cytochrome c oxidase subunit 1
MASWLVTTDHKRIGILYISTSVVFLVLAGLMALVMRTQLAQANEDLISAQHYNQLFTIHGTTMVFLVGVPVLAGFANYLVPLMIGAEDMAFPRLNALSYWFYFLGGAVLMLSFFAHGGAGQAGWTLYPPLSEQQPGNGIDYQILSLHMLTVSTVAGAVNFLVTIHNLRTRGMSWTRMPLFVWSIELYSWLIMAVMPVLSAALTLLLLDRGISIGPWDVQTHFFNPAEGGSALLYQHALWFFAAPRGTSSCWPFVDHQLCVLPVFARKPIFGYKAIVASTVAIGFFSMPRVGAPHVHGGTADPARPGS